MIYTLVALGAFVVGHVTGHFLAKWEPQRLLEEKASNGRRLFYGKELYDVKKKLWPRQD